MNYDWQKYRDSKSAIKIYQKKNSHVRGGGEQEYFIFLKSFLSHGKKCLDGVLHFNGYNANIVD